MQRNNFEFLKEFVRSIDNRKELIYQNFHVDDSLDQSLDKLKNKLKE